MNDVAKRFLGVSAYAIAMAFLEAVVVVYIRGLLQITNDHVALGPYVTMETWREAATLVMLVAVGWLAGHKRSDRLAYGLFAFGLWDIWYYIWLKVLTGWPETLLGWDVLFLIPLRWWGPVLAPVLIAALICIAAVIAVVRLERGERLGFTPARIGVAALGGLLALYVFMSDSIHALLQGRADWDTLRPEPFQWALFLVALALMALPSLVATWPGRGARENRGQPYPHINPHTIGGTMNSALTIVPHLLRDPAAFFESVRRGKNLEAQCCWLAASSTVSLIIYGFVMGLSHSPGQALSSAIKMPILLVGTGLLCLPALYFFALALGMPLRMAQVAAVILAGISVMALLLLGLSPVMLIFILTSTSYSFFQLLAVASVAISGSIGVWYMWRGMARVNLFDARVPMSARRVLMGAWFVLYAFVGSQMAWRLSPFIGDPALPFVWLQPSRDNLYVAAVHAFERVSGLPLPTENLPVWIGGLGLILFCLVWGVGLVASAEEV